jgi:hypothetical protein
MTIQRQYSLPNCKLVLQGLNNDATDLSGRPLLSMVTNVECYLGGQKTPIVGGRDFLESLVQSVSYYAQGYLSGIQHLIRRDRQHMGMVQIQQIEPNLHRLTVQPEAGAGSPSEVNLTTVQLFDLVEAVDQFFADAQTLPDLSLKLDPLSKRHVVSPEPLAKRATPAAVGLSGLAAAAAILFMLPVPEVRRPESASEQTSEQTTEALPLTSPTPESSPESSPTAESPAAESTASSSPTAATAEDAANSTAGDDGAGLNLATVPEITDPAELDQLTVQLYDRLDLAWTKEPTFDGELNYRVGVNENGDIVGYKYANDAALTYLTDTPLADVQFSPTPESATGEPASDSASSTTSTEPIAQFRVVFKSDGVLEVSPWNGQVIPEDETAPETESGDG